MPVFVTWGNTSSIVLPLCCSLCGCHDGDSLLVWQLIGVVQYSAMQLHHWHGVFNYQGMLVQLPSVFVCAKQHKK